MSVVSPVRFTWLLYLIQFGVYAIGSYTLCDFRRVAFLGYVCFIYMLLSICVFICLWIYAVAFSGLGYLD